MTAPNRPCITPEIIKRFQDYAVSGNMGFLSDKNRSDKALNEWLTYLQDRKDTEGSELIKLLISFTYTQRKKISALCVELSMTGFVKN